MMLCKSDLLKDNYKLFYVVYEKIAYKDTIFVNENLRININVYLFA
jgi:hypothetical protein